MFGQVADRLDAEYLDDDVVGGKVFEEEVLVLALPVYSVDLVLVEETLVEVLDVDAAYARFVGLGFIGEIAPVSLGTTARISFVRDPDGGYVELSQRAEFTGRPIPPGDPGIVVP